MTLALAGLVSGKRRSAVQEVVLSLPAALKHGVGGSRTQVSLCAYPAGLLPPCRVVMCSASLDRWGSVKGEKKDTSSVKSRTASATRTLQFMAISLHERV